ncbi:B-cell lymphoma 6-like [Homarus americanus]|uniref:B-cell lymphoma 6-like n=1 Tax=Homarus americanus TaxID=6706 RepID=A0A8J5NEN5_HOMAM|nr:B-cell lymphoma 6-like [Homarus americanus]
MVDQILDEFSLEQQIMEFNETNQLLDLLKLNTEKTSEEGKLHTMASNAPGLVLDDDHLESTETLLNDLIHSVCGVETHSSKVIPPKTEGNNTINDAKCDIVKATTSTTGSNESPRLHFQLSDNMKKGLSMLAFPSKKTTTRKKATASRTTSNSRITIGEALEKAQDARKSISSVIKGVGQPENIEGAISSDPAVQHLPLGSSVVIGSVPPGKTRMDTGVEMGLSGKTGVTMRVTVGEKENWRNTTTEPAHSVPASPIEGPHNDQQVSMSTSSTEGKRVPLAGKAKSSATTRIKLSARMWELLRFTFIHEHFPTSVHMARLAKMMGVQWSQVRNWFTDRRVENKRSGIFPRDKVLLCCPYCEVSLESEADQKNHLFSKQHVRKVLGPEFNGGNAAEAIKWKKLPNDINAVSKSSGARVLAVGYASTAGNETLLGPEDGQSDAPKKLMDALDVSNEVKLKRLQKRWKESVLLQSEREQDAKWSASGTPLNKKPVEIKGGNDKGEEKKDEQSVLFIKMEDGEERFVKNVSDDYSQSSAEILDSENFLVNNKSVSVSTTVSSNIPLVGLGDPCSSKSENLGCQNVCDSVNIKLNDVPNTTLARKRKLSHEGENIDNGKYAESSKLPRALLKEPKIEKDSGFEEVRKNMSTDAICKVSNRQDQEKKITASPVRVTEQPTLNASSTNPRNITPLFSQSLLDVSRLGTKVPESSYSNTNFQQVYSRKTHTVRVSYSGSPHVRSLRGIKHSLDETAVLGYQCPTCSKIFQTEWQMLKHSLTHCRYLCDICEQKFTSENMLKRHIHAHLTGAYEDEKYYCRFSCKTCHSLVCECYEPIYCKPREMPKGYTRPQKARRSKKTFISKPNSAPNDHLIVTVGEYKKFVNNPSGLGNVRSARQGAHVQKKSSTVPGKSSIHPTQKLQIRSNVEERACKETDVKHTKLHVDVKHTKLHVDVKHTKLHVEPKECESQDNAKQTTVSVSSPKDTAQTFISNIVTSIKIEPVASSISEDIIIEEEFDGPNRGRRTGSRRRSSKLSSNFIYKDTDFYYMCEMCDASFLSKAELSEHMFFHRLKSRSRRGEKRGTPGTAEEEREEVLKRLKVEELQNSEEVETINVGGFERFKCPMCKGHFESVPDLNRHRTQAHKGVDTDISLDEKVPVRCAEVFQCTYCEKFYRRERELRRHLKHDCVRAPKYLKSKLSLGVTLSYLENMGDGPHYRMVKRNQDENLTIDSSPTKTPPKVAQRGPITCKYCNLVTRREAEMKRHVWKYCSKVPKDIVKRFKEGATLAELGFVFCNEKFESPEKSSPISDSSPNEKEKFSSIPVCEILSSSPVSQVTSTPSVSSSPVSQVTTTPSVSSPVLQVTTTPSISSPVSQVTTTPLASSSPVSQVTTTPSVSSPVSQVTTTPSISSPVSQVTTTPSSDSQATIPVSSPMLALPLPMVSFSKSKEPLVCSYCGIWYFREVAILKHMKERCIRLPLIERELLKNGGRLCNVLHKENEVNESSELCKAVYKKVEVPKNLPDSVQDSLQQNLDSSSTDIMGTRVEAKASDEGKKEEDSTAISEVQTPVPVTPAPATPTTGRGRPGPNKRGTRCRRCHETFKTPDAVLAHSSVHHGPKKGFYKCKLCHLRLVKYKQLREHVWEHTDETPYKCHVCEVKYRFSDLLVEHLHAIHQYKLINERNLYKWLPGRNGKYREIKPVVKDNCEERLEDIDTSLDNVAEVMVITDKDVWTSKNEADTSVDSEIVVAGKLDKVSKEEVDDHSQPLKSEESAVQKSPERNTSANSELESEKCIPNKSDAEVNKSTVNANHSVGEKESTEDGDKDDQAVGKNFKKVEQEIVNVGEVTVELKEKCTKARESSEKLGVVTAENEDEKSNIDSKAEEEETDLEAQSEKIEGVTTELRKETPAAGNESIQTDFANQEKVSKCVDKLNTKSGAKPDTQDSGKLRSIVAEDEEGFAENGEGLLSNVENLESVIETIQLTDKYLET